MGSGLKRKLDPSELQVPPGDGKRSELARGRWRSTLPLLVLAFSLTHPIHADSKGTFYVLQMDLREDDIGSRRDPGWGLGARIAIPMLSTREVVKLTGGFEAGNLESVVNDGSADGLSTGFVTTQGFQRLTGGIEVGRHLDAKIRPHLGVSAALLRQDVQTFFLDAFGGPAVFRSDSDTRFSYDLSIGLGIAITRKMGLDLGVREMRGFKIKVSGDDGSSTTIRPDYRQVYLGVTRRFAWPHDQVELP